MKISSFLGAGLLGLLVAVSAAAPGFAQSLRVLTGDRAARLNVPMNRAVVVESERPFAELSIANPEIADISTLSDRTIYVLGKAPGRTTLTLLGADGGLIGNVEISVTPDIAEFKERLQQILPGEKIEVRTANDGIVLSGSVSSAAKLDRALELAERYAPGRVSNLMTVGGTQQVMLKVRFAEMRRSVTKSLSSSLGIGGTIFGDDAVRGGNGQFVTETNASALTDGLASTGAVFAGEATGRYALGFNLGGLEFQVLLEALESKGVVRTLAEPNLTALSGQEATFLAGGEYPIPVVGKDGDVTIMYKPFGVELSFIPRVVDGNIINLEIKAAVSAIDTTIAIQNGGFAVNGFSRREASSTVEMRDGESFAIAGLLKDDFTNLKGQVPWLGDVPVLGALFRSAEYARNQSELVIIVTPHLVTPVTGEALSLPTDNVRLPTEADFFLFGNVLKGKGPKSGGAAEVARQDFEGSYGYVME
ncbi:MAG: type II and III secretion system protein family protein [Alphaproteobacteria bacterium]|nr:MAG: type II and III secretion system protein family protein [Alphaproteobacteria bacterium]